MRRSRAGPLCPDDWPRVHVGRIPTLLFSLRTRALLLAGLVFTVLLVTFGYHEAAERQRRLELVGDKLLDSARLLASQQQHGFDLAQEALDLLVAAQPFNADERRKGCDRMLRREVHEEPLIGDVEVALPDGSVVCRAIATDAQANIGHEAYFRKALVSPNLVIGESAESRVTGRQLLLFAKAIRDPTGEAQHVVVVAFDASRLRAKLADAKHPHSASVGVIDSTGRVLVSDPDPAGWVGKNASQTPFFRAATAHGGEGTFVNVGLGGTADVYGLAQLTQPAARPILLWVGLAKDRATQAIDQVFMRTVGAAVALLALLFAGAWVAGERLLLRPVAALADAALRVGRGDLSARTGLGHGRDELRRLGRSFDDMARSLEAKDRQTFLAARAVKVLSAWNLAASTRDNDPTPIEDMCRALVEEGGYCGAWVGYAKDDPEGSIEPVAGWGSDAHMLERLQAASDASGRQLGLAAAAIQRGAVVIENGNEAKSDATGHGRYAPGEWHNSIVALPLKADDAVLGVLTICSAEADAFGAQETALLTEVAAALSSSIAALRSRAERARLEASVRTTEARFRAAAEASLDALFIMQSRRDRAGDITDFELAEVNSRAERKWAINRRALIGQTLSQLVPAHTVVGLLDVYVKVVNTRQPFEGEFELDVPARGKRWFRQQVVPVGDGVAVTIRDVTYQKWSGERIRQSEEQLRLAMDAATMGTWSMDFATRTCSISEGVGPIFGRPRGKGPASFEECLNAVHPEDRDALTASLEQDWATRLPTEIEFRLLWPDGTVHWVEAHANIIRDASGQPVRKLGVLTDVTKRKLDAMSLQRANRALKTLSAGNAALVRARDESALLHSVCQVLVETGGYRLVAVAEALNDPNQTLKPVAWAGSEQGYFSRTHATWADTSSEPLPVVRAVRSGTTQVSRNIASDPSYGSWADAAVKRGFASNLALPLREGPRVFGVLSIYATEPDAFDAEETRLLEELAGDLAYGIVALRTTAERDRIAYAHQHHDQILRKSLEDSIQAIAATVELRDAYTSGHQKRVAQIAVAIGKEMGLNARQARRSASGGRRA